MDEQAVAQFAELGVQIPAQAMDEEDVIEIWDINRAAFEAFQGLDTQWRYLAVVGLAGAAIERTGLDYAAVKIVMARHDLVDSDFDLIQAMETAALEAYAEAGQ